MVAGEVRFDPVHPQHRLALASCRALERAAFGTRHVEPAELTPGQLIDGVEADHYVASLTPRSNSRSRADRARLRASADCSNCMVVAVAVGSGSPAETLVEP